MRCGSPTVVINDKTLDALTIEFGAKGVGQDVSTLLGLAVVTSLAIEPGRAAIIARQESSSAYVLSRMGDLTVSLGASMLEAKDAFDRLAQAFGALDRTCVDDLRSDRLPRRRPRRAFALAGLPPP